MPCIRESTRNTALHQCERSSQKLWSVLTFLFVETKILLREAFIFCVVISPRGEQVLPWDWDHDTIGTISKINQNQDGSRSQTPSNRNSWIMTKAISSKSNKNTFAFQVSKKTVNNVVPFRVFSCAAETDIFAFIHSGLGSIPHIWKCFGIREMFSWTERIPRLLFLFWQDFLRTAKATTESYRLFSSVFLLQQNHLNIFPF